MPTGWLAKIRLVAERMPAGAVPVPERATVWGLSAALSVKSTEALRAPAALGAKATANVHLAEAPSEEVQLLFKLKS